MIQFTHSVLILHQIIKLLRKGLGPPRRPVQILGPPRRPAQILPTVSFQGHRNKEAHFSLLPVQTGARLHPEIYFSRGRRAAGSDYWDHDHPHPRGVLLDVREAHYLPQQDGSRALQQTKARQCPREALHCHLLFQLTEGWLEGLLASIYTRLSPSLGDSGPYVSECASVRVCACVHEVRLGRASNIFHSIICPPRFLFHSFHPNLYLTKSWNQISLIKRSPLESLGGSVG